MRGSVSVLRGRFVRLDGGDVSRLDLVKGPVSTDFSALEPDRPRAKPCEHRVIMAGGNHDAAAVEDRMCTVLQEGPELMVKRLVHFVQKKNLRIYLLRDGETKPCPHSLRVGEDGPLERLVERAPCLDVLHCFQDRAPREPRDGAEKKRVLAAGKKAEYASVDGEKRRHTSSNLELSPIRHQDARENAQERRLARAAPTDQRRALAASYRKGGVSKPPERGAVAAQASLHGCDDPKVAIEEELDADAFSCNHLDHLRELTLLDPIYRHENDQQQHGTRKRNEQFPRGRSAAEQKSVAIRLEESCHRVQAQQVPDAWIGLAEGHQPGREEEQDPDEAHDKRPELPKPDTAQDRGVGRRDRQQEIDQKDQR